jgi:predicted CXXCH cytochrome family protein
LIEKPKKKEKHMRKFFYLALSLLLGMMLVSTAIAGTEPNTGIVGSAHDLTLIGGGTSSLFGDATEQAAQDRLCIYCHAPHHTMKPGTVSASGAVINYVPLWNHAISTIPVFTMYDNGPDEPLDAQHISTAKALAGSPGSLSMLCLSCHDGSVATNQYGFAPAGASEIGAGDQYITAVSRGYIGGAGDLSNHHPIGFDYTQVAYDDGGADYEIAGTATMMTANRTIGDLLSAGTQMECGTCHDVHNTGNLGLKLVWVDDQGSAFCLTCHLKAQGWATFVP